MHRAAGMIDGLPVQYTDSFVKRHPMAIFWSQILLSPGALDRYKVEFEVRLSRVNACPLTYKNARGDSHMTANFFCTAKQPNGVCGAFGRLRLPLEAEDDEARSDMLEICMRLSNIRTKRVRISQIRTVYMPIWQDGYERLWEGFETMLFGEIQKADRVARFHGY